MVLDLAQALAGYLPRHIAETSVELDVETPENRFVKAFCDLVLGVIESVVIYLLPHADLIGPLLVFRFVYFLVPLAIGGALLVTTEILLGSTEKDGAAPEAPDAAA